MKVTIRIVLAFLLIIGALASYSFGHSSGMFVFIVLGLALEFGFWLNLFPIKRKKSAQTS